MTKALKEQITSFFIQGTSFKEKELCISRLLTLVSLRNEKGVPRLPQAQAWDALVVEFVSSALLVRLPILPAIF